MKRIMARAVTLAAMVSLCLLLWFSIKPPVEAQAASAVTVNNYTDLVKYCGNKTIDYTITIGSNFKVTGVVFVYGNKTIKGNGKTLTCDTEVEMFHIHDYSSLTVENLTVDRTSCPTNHIFYVERRGNLVINSGTYKAGPTDTLKGVSVVKAYGRCTVNGGDFSGSSGRFYGVSLHGPYSYTINGGNFHDCTTSVGLLQYQKGDEASDALWELEGFTQTLTINGGNFHDNQNNGVTIGNTDVDQPGASTVIVNNGNFYNNGLNGISVVDDAAELKIKRINSYGNNVGLYVAKGKITGISTAADAAYLNIYNNKTYNVYVTDGGTFSAGHGNIYSDGAQTQIGVYVRKSSFATIKAGLNIKGHTTD